MIGLLLIAFGIPAIVNGVLTWRGQEMQFVLEHQRKHGPMTSPVPLMGARRLYQTTAGAAACGVPTGIASVMMGIAVVIRDLLEKPEDWWLMYVVSYPAGALVFAGGLYALAYFWTGVPDKLRPPSQRGWKVTRNGYELVRPEAVPESERHL